MEDHPAVRHVPTGSTPLRELAHAVDQTLTLPAPANARDELCHLRIHRDCARLVRQAMRRVLADREASDGDIMAIVTSLRDQAAQLPDDSYDRRPSPS